jgi:hypothetical protein
MPMDASHLLATHGALPLQRVSKNSTHPVPVSPLPVHQRTGILEVTVMPMDAFHLRATHGALPLQSVSKNPILPVPVSPLPVHQPT